MYDNEIILNISAISQNESFARVAAASAVSQLDPTVSELTDIKTAVSEAVTNSVIHGYTEQSVDNKIVLTMKINEKDRFVYIEIEDFGVGIENIDEALTPLYTSKPEEERSGMGFTVMETFMDKLEVVSEKDKGTKIIMTKKLSD